MKVYLAAPLVKRRNPSLTEAIARTISAQGHDILSTWVLDRKPDWGLSPRGVFDRDLEALERADLLVAEVSVPSHGVGMEVMAAYLRHKQTLLIHSTRTKVSALLRGLPNTVVKCYGSRKQLQSILQHELLALDATGDDRMS